MLDEPDRDASRDLDQRVVDAIAFLDDQAARAIEPCRAAQRNGAGQKARQIVFLAGDLALARDVDADQIAVRRGDDVLEGSGARAQRREHALASGPLAAQHDRRAGQIDHRRVFERVLRSADLHVARRDDRKTAIVADRDLVARHVMDRRGDVAMHVRGRRAGRDDGSHRENRRAHFFVDDHALRTECFQPNRRHLPIDPVDKIGVLDDALARHKPQLQQVRAGQIGGRARRRGQAGETCEREDSSYVHVTRLSA